MDWKTWLSVFAAVVPLIGIIAQAARSPLDQVRYNRWLQIRQNASTDWERALSTERLQHYAVEFGVRDRSAPRRKGALVMGTFAVLVSLGIFTAGLAVQPLIGNWVWGVHALAFAVYLGGLYLIVQFPDRERDQVREEIEALIEAGSSLPVDSRGAVASRFRAFFRWGKRDLS